LGTIVAGAVFYDTGVGTRTKTEASKVQESSWFCLGSSRIQVPVLRFQMLVQVFL